MPEQYKHWKGEGMEQGTIVIRRRMNKTYIPPELEGAKENHIYTDVVDENGIPGKAYVAVPYEHQSLPAILYHPEYHTAPAPILNDFKSMGDYNAAEIKWKRKYDRTLKVESDKEFKRLTGKGWLPKPPEVATPKDDPHSEEI